jgi:poly(A) polymerase/tRNA nucleotidyltransferase (CCA-adding enzyme)
MKDKIPQYLIKVISKLEAGGFEGYVVGGCVRDLLLDKEPKNWDVATNARPEEVMKIFPDSVYENEFGTVGVKIKENDETIDVVEITTYRVESKYSDKRHPDEIEFAKTLEEDLSRRDFTINALALKLKGVKGMKGEEGFEIIDLFGGREDLGKKIIRAVGKADDRFNEDALRMLRAVRFAVALNNQETKNKIQTKSKVQISNEKPNSKDKIQNSSWQIESDTVEAIKKNAKNLKYISAERIKDELEKIILAPTPAKGIEMLHETGLLQYIIPEIEIGVGVTQSHHHYYGPYNTVYKHLVASLEKCPSEKLEVRLAALLHDVGKPKTKRGEGESATFYNHEYAGAKMAERILERLKFSRKVIDNVALLVKNHMFYYNVVEVGEAGVRRVVRKVGLENINDLIDVRIADRLGSGVPKAVPYKLRHFKFMVEKVSHDAVSVKQLKINGHDLMTELKLQPGPKIGAILDILLSRVIDDPSLNEKAKLVILAEELNKEELSSLRNQAKRKIQEEQKEEEEIIKKKHWVE